MRGVRSATKVKILERAEFGQSALQIKDGLQLESGGTEILSRRKIRRVISKFKSEVSCSRLVSGPRL